MTLRDESSSSKAPIDVALAEFHEAWFSGKCPDPEAFCASHPECGSELRKAVDSFFFALKSLSHAMERKEDTKKSKMVGRLLGDFRIFREIGRGGMGVIYEAEQVSLKRKVALKLLPSHLSLSEDAVNKFKREAEAGGRQKDIVLKWNRMGQDVPGHFGHP